MYCWPYHRKVWQGHGPTCHTDSALHGLIYQGLVNNNLVKFSQVIPLSGITYKHGVRNRGIQGVHGPPRIKLGSPVIGLDPHIFKKNIKFFVKIKELIILYILIFSRMKIFSRNSRERYICEINLRENFELPLYTRP